MAKKGWKVPNGGHRFGPQLICRAVGCEQTWFQQQQEPTCCEGERGSPHRSELAKQVQAAKIPLNEIADACGYTRTTVRRVLTPGLWPDLLEDTIAKVESAARAALATRAGSAGTPPAPEPRE